MIILDVVTTTIIHIMEWQEVWGEALWPEFWPIFHAVGLNFW